MGKPNVLIAGASIAGPCLAYWLVKAGCSVTIVERSPELRTSGQSIDIRNDGVRIMRKMGLEEKIRAKVTHEAGIQFVSSKGKVVATLGATGNAESQSLTSEFEIFRGDLARILVDATDGLDVKYIYGDYIKSIVQNEKAHTVTVEFQNQTPITTYDLVVGCDGLGSRTRALAFNTDTREYLNPLNTYVAWFTVEKDLLEGSKFAKWHSATNGRSILIRPDPSGANRVSLIVVGPKDSRDTINQFLEVEKTSGSEGIKKLFADLHRNAGWVSNEAVDGMMSAKDFYSGEIAQIYTPTLSRGRVALGGDAAFCPSPISGSGTTAAFVGAYILAGEVGKSIKKGEDLDEALKRYDEVMIPKARQYQKLIPGTPQLLNPQTQWGIMIMHLILGFLQTFGVIRLMERLSGLASMNTGVGLPDYSWDP